MPDPSEYSLYVLALSRSVTLAALIDALAAELGPLQMVELVAVPALKVVDTPPPWWAGLAKDAHVRVTAPTAALYSAPDTTKLTTRTVSAGADLTLWAPARSDGWLDVYQGKLWIRAEAVGPA